MFILYVRQDFLQSKINLISTEKILFGLLRLLANKILAVLIKFLSDWRKSRRAYNNTPVLACHKIFGFATVIRSHTLWTVAKAPNVAGRKLYTNRFSRIRKLFLRLAAIFRGFRDSTIFSRFPRLADFFATHGFFRAFADIFLRFSRLVTRRFFRCFRDSQIFSRFRDLRIFSRFPRLAIFSGSWIFSLPNLKSIVTYHMKCQIQ